jgi:hypothetical protein
MPRLAALLLIALLAPAASAQEGSDAHSGDASLRAAAQTYGRAWLRADSSALGATLHPAARRQIVLTADGVVVLEEQDAATMRASAADLTPSDADTNRVAVRVLVQDATSAVAEVELPLWSERVTFVWWNDRWLVVHALWRLRAAE